MLLHNLSWDMFTPLRFHCGLLCWYFGCVRDDSHDFRRGVLQREQERERCIYKSTWVGQTELLSERLSNMWTEICSNVSGICVAQSLEDSAGDSRGRFWWVLWKAGNPNKQRQHRNKMFTGLSRDCPGLSRQFPQVSWEFVYVFPFKKGNTSTILTPTRLPDNPEKWCMFIVLFVSVAIMSVWRFVGCKPASDSDSIQKLTVPHDKVGKCQVPDLASLLPILLSFLLRFMIFPVFVAGCVTMVPGMLSKVST